MNIFQFFKWWFIKPFTYIKSYYSLNHLNKSHDYKVNYVTKNTHKYLFNLSHFKPIWREMRNNIYRLMIYIENIKNYINIYIKFF